MNPSKEKAFSFINGDAEASYEVRMSAMEEVKETMKEQPPLSKLIRNLSPIKNDEPVKRRQTMKLPVEKGSIIDNGELFDFLENQYNYPKKKIVEE